MWFLVVIDSKEKTKENKKLASELYINLQAGIFVLSYQQKIQKKTTPEINLKLSEIYQKSISDDEARNKLLSEIDNSLSMAWRSKELDAVYSLTGLRICLFPDMQPWKP